MKWPEKDGWPEALTKLRAELDLTLVELGAATRTNAQLLSEWERGLTLPGHDERMRFFWRFVTAGYPGKFLVKFLVDRETLIEQALMDEARSLKNPLPPHGSGPVA